MHSLVEQLVQLPIQAYMERFFNVPRIWNDTLHVIIQVEGHLKNKTSVKLIMIYGVPLYAHEKFLHIWDEVQ